ncbi:MAG TPA: radical SAM protein [Planctomycetota bacterium]|nr:radical SAM protein [Planctomycetota bacterium]
MRVLVLNPPSVSAANVKRDSIYGCWCKGKRIGGAQTPPWPLLSIASTLKADGYDARFIDGQAEDIEFEAVAKDIATRDAVVMMCSVMTFSEDKRILEAVKKIKPSVKTVVCGAMGTFLPDLTLKHGEGLIDVLIRREPEFIIRDVLRSNGDWKKVQGISYAEDGKTVSNPDYPLIEDLDQIPHVDWTLLSPHAQYFNPIAKRFPYRTDITTRGCYARCTYCMAPGFYGGKVRYRSADNVLELWRRHAQEGIKEIYIRDELFTCVQKRNREICERMISEKLDLSWICSSRVGLTRDELELFHKAGCHYIKFGVENGDQEILDRMKKGVQVEQIRETFRYCHEVGINTHAHFMIGCPGETKETIQKTVDLAKEIDPTTATFGVLTPYPGTPLFDEIAEKHPEIRESLIDLEHLHAENHFSSSITSLSTDEIQDAVKRVHRDFFLRPGYIWGWVKRAKVKDLPRIAKAGLNVAMFAVKGDD